MANKRLRLELTEETYETLHYFALLRGHSLGTLLRNGCAIYADEIREQFPIVYAHMLAWKALHGAEPESAPIRFSNEPNDTPF